MASLDRELESDVVTHGKEPVVSDGCIFCKIIQGKEEANIVFKVSMRHSDVNLVCGVWRESFWISCLKKGHTEITG